VHYLPITCAAVAFVCAVLLLVGVQYVRRRLGRTRMLFAVTFPETQVDFGRVAMGQSLTCELWFRNSGRRPVRVRKLYSSSESILPEIDLPLIKSGQWNAIRIRLETSKLQSPTRLNERIAVYFEAAELEPFFLDVLADVTSDVVVEPSIVKRGRSLRVPGWRAGIARAKITPEKPLWLAGYRDRKFPAGGKLHDLWIKVLALESADGGMGVVVTSDLLGFPGGMANRICHQLESRCGLTRSQIMLTCSHTHCGPVLQDALIDCYPLGDQQLAMISEYSRNLERTVVSAVTNAICRLAPATLWAGEGKADFAVNRSANPEADVAAMKGQRESLHGPVDTQVPVLAVRSDTGRLRAVVFGYACHNATLDIYRWNGDYAGFAQIELEKAHPEATAMFFQACGGDQNPLPRGRVELCREFGAMLATAVEEPLGKPMRPIGPELRTTFARVDLEFQQPLTMEELRSDMEQQGARGRRARRLLAVLDQSKPMTDSYPYPVQVWRFGSDQLWIALGGEVVVDFALRFRARYGPMTWVTGYANDVMAYIPSERVWKEAGYEAGAFHVYGLPAEGWATGVEARIASAVHALVEQSNSVSDGQTVN
jgi:neutral ceramidase